VRLKFPYHIRFQSVYVEEAMKPRDFLLPGLTFAAGSIWLLSQTASLSRLENENSNLRQRLAAHASRPTAAASKGETRNARSATPSPKTKAGLDWKQLAADMREMQRTGGMGDMRAMLRLQQQIQSMSVEEILSAFDEIAALDLPDHDRIVLEQMLVGPLALKSPETALNKFVDRLQENNGSWTWQLSNALKGWAQQDLPAATAWFDKQIAAGTFDSKSLDGRSDARINFEGAFIASILGKDPATAGARLSALPVNQRAQVLQNHELANLPEKDHPAFAALVREQIPEKEQAGTLAYSVSRIAAQKGYADVTRYIEAISATDGERTAIVAKASESRIRQLSHNQKIGTAEIDEMRAWAESQAPGSADETTGAALRDINNPKNSFAETAALAASYNTEVLATFLENNWRARHEKELSRSLAEQIPDETRRAKILEKLK
jgi:hypothetical protein